ncbi:MAG TPA: heme biosynthesis protein HemY, partial [Xanthomonadaceae bacterium]|nr:heme biosynthesis protein HemY [Xanthomonadaceae bacterium]
GRWAESEDYLQRALAQGAGSAAWEELGHGYASAGDEARARIAYANALRTARGESAAELPSDDRFRAVAPVVAEERDEHGMPRLRQ